MTEERRRWREYYEQKWPAEIHGYEETAERIAFISQQRKEAARDALEAAAREIENIRYLEGNYYDRGHNDPIEEAVSIITKHIEEL